MAFHVLSFPKTVPFVLAALLPIMNLPGGAPIFHPLTITAPLTTPAIR